MIRKSQECCPVASQRAAFHLLTREFYELLKKRLAPGGVAVFNVHGGTRLFESTMKTLTDVFGHVERNNFV